MSKSYQPDSLHPYIMDERLKKATGSGGITEIPIASADTVGGIMIGGSANPITVTGSGNASVRKATSELLGVVKGGSGTTIGADGSINVETYTPPAYSTTEHLTGRKWIDNKDIYEKTVNFGALPNNTSKEVEHGITYDNIINIESVAKNTSDTCFPIPYVAEDNKTTDIRLVVNPTKIVIACGTDRSGLSAYVTIQYTKPTTP